MALGASGKLDAATTPRENGYKDDDWEYEYDDTATEEFYFTLDLSTYRSDESAKRQAQSLGIKPKKRKRRRLTKQGQTATLYENDEAEKKEQQQPDEPPDEQDQGDEAKQTPIVDFRPNQPNTIEFLDLGSTNPFVKFNDCIYSCHWMTDLGSQLYVTQHGEVGTAAFRGHVLDILGASQARLVGKPVSLRRKDSPRRPTDANGTSVAHAISIEDDIESSVAPTPSVDATPVPSTPAPIATEQFVVPPEKIRDDQSRRQANFLERLAAIKLKKGETDRVPLSAIKIYNTQLVPNREEVRAAALAADARKGKAKAAALEDVDIDDNNPNPVQTRGLESSQLPERSDEAPQVMHGGKAQVGGPSFTNAGETSSQPL